MPTTTHPDLQERLREGSQERSQERSQDRRSQHLFVVRLWQEVDAVTTMVQWRGLVKHVLSEQNHYFTHLPDLLTFINTVTCADAILVTAETTPVALLGAQLQPEQRQQHADEDDHSRPPGV